MSEKREAYSELLPETRDALQKVINEFRRVQTIQGQLITFLIAGMRALADKAGLDSQEIQPWIEPAQAHGLEILGVHIGQEEVSAEERYEHEGIKVWDGVAKPHA